MKENTIRVQDLKLGNLFHLEVRKQIRTVSIGVIHRNSIIVDVLPNYTSIRITPLEIMPIVLNDEEMLNMGFKLKTENDAKFWKHPSLDGSISYGTHKFQYQHNLKFNYVHELQMFMLGITKKEVIYTYRIYDKKK